MSMPNGYVRCHGCTFEGVMQRRPVTLEYVLPSGELVEGYRTFAWCSTCCNITDAEEAMDETSIRNEIAAIELRNRGLAKRIFGRSANDVAELNALRAKLRLAVARRSPPRCLRCGQPTVLSLEFDSSGTSNVTHSCGRRLFLVPEDPDATRFMFRPQVIRLDTEGRTQ
jgi:hypothetical protein